MSEKMRLNNPHEFAVGIITPDKPYGINILPHAFTMVTKDELDYIGATSTLLRDGVLRLAEERQQELAETLGIDMKDNANFMSDEDIKKKLSGNANQLRKWLDSDDIKPYVIDKIAKLAKEMNLAMSKIKVLQEKLPDYDWFE